MTMKIHYYRGGWQYWYDHSTRCWWAAKFDKDGNQVGDAIHAARKWEVVGEIQNDPELAF